MSVVETRWKKIRGERRRRKQQSWTISDDDLYDVCEQSYQTTYNSHSFDSLRGLVFSTCRTPLTLDIDQETTYTLTLLTIQVLSVRALRRYSPPPQFNHTVFAGHCASVKMKRILLDTGLQSPACFRLDQQSMIRHMIRYAIESHTMLKTRRPNETARRRDTDQLSLHQQYRWRRRIGCTGRHAAAVPIPGHTQQVARRTIDTVFDITLKSVTSRICVARKRRVGPFLRRKRFRTATGRRTASNGAPARHVNLTRYIASRFGRFCATKRKTNDTQGNKDSLCRNLDWNF